MSIFNERFRELKELKNIMAKDLASDLELANSKLSYYLNGNSEPSYDLLVKIAKYFNVTTDYLTGNDENNQDNAVDELVKLKILFDKVESENKQLKEILSKINVLSSTSN